MWTALTAAAVAAGSSNNNTVTTAPVDTSGADFLVAIVSDYSAGSRAVVTDSKSNTWNALTSTQSGANARNTIWWARPTTVGSGHTFTATGTGTFPTIDVLAFSGSAVSPFDQESGAVQAFGTSVQPGSLTPPQNDCLVVTGFTADAAAGSLACSGGFTISTNVGVSGNHERGALAYLIQTTAAAVNPTWSWSPNTTAAVRQATFKAASIELIASLTQALASVTLVAPGTVEIRGDVTVTAADLVVIATATAAVAGTSTPTLDPLTVAAAAIVDVAGVLTQSLDAVVCHSAGVIQSLWRPVARPGSAGYTTVLVASQMTTGLTRSVCTTALTPSATVGET